MNPNQILNQITTKILNNFIKKRKSFKMLQSEMRESPHSRSFEQVNTLAKFRGMHSGFEMSETFIISFSRN